MNFTDYSRLRNGFSRVTSDSLEGCGSLVCVRIEMALVSNTLERNLLCGHADRYQNESKFGVGCATNSNSKKGGYKISNSSPASLARVLPSFLVPATLDVGSSCALRIDDVLNIDVLNDSSYIEPKTRSRGLANKNGYQDFSKSSI